MAERIKIPNKKKKERSDKETFKYLGILKAAWLGGESDPLWIVQEIEIWAYEECYMDNPGEWDAETSQGFWDSNGSPNLRQTARPSDSQQKREFAK